MTSQAASPASAKSKKRGSQNGDLQAFTDLGLFAKAVEDAGLSIDFLPLLSLNANFIESTEDFLVLNLKHFDTEEPNNLLFLHSEKALLYSRMPLSPEALQPHAGIQAKAHGKTTVLAFLALKRTVNNYKTHLDTLVARIRELESQFDNARYRALIFDFERLFDRLEDLHQILIKLEETNLKEVETRYISFDYQVLMTESANQLDRCRNRLNMLKDLQREHELQTTVELNRRIERLNNVVTRLTAVTVIIMVPTLIASHFGMNFTNMPELDMKWTYPAVLALEVLLIVSGVLLFRKIKWL
ncbi:MAG: magnesium transporter CorA family protein [SAR202 cluster bacterium]|nr:magnesium transporter CorA family protein [SAR202 cluster bacterium]